MITFTIQSHKDFQDIFMSRMGTLSKYSQEHFLGGGLLGMCRCGHRVQVPCGCEILSSLFVTLHSAFLQTSRDRFAYEQWPKSQAYVPVDEGDFYYTGALFGGSVAEVSRLTQARHQAIMTDNTNHIEAVWHDESYLKYLLYHKPTKILSSEYMFSRETALRKFLKDHESLSLFINLIRVLELPKNYTITQRNKQPPKKRLRKWRMTTQALWSF